MAYRPTYYWPARPASMGLPHRAPGGGGFGGPTARTRPTSPLDLSAAMRQNPHLMVYSLNGLYDMATPFFGTEYDLAHMQLDPELKPTCASPTTPPATWSI